MTEILTAVMCRFCGRGTGRVATQAQLAELSQEERLCDECKVNGVPIESTVVDEEGATTYHCEECDSAQFYITETQRVPQFGSIDTVADGDRTFWIEEHGEGDLIERDTAASCRQCGRTVELSSVDYA